MWAMWAMAHPLYEILVNKRAFYKTFFKNFTSGPPTFKMPTSASKHKDSTSKTKDIHEGNEQEAQIIQSTAESQNRNNKIKNEALELAEMPIFESDSTYLDKEIKEENKD